MFWRSLLGDDMKLAKKMRLFFYPAVLLPFLLILLLSVLIFHGYLSMAYDVDVTGNEFFEFLNPLSLQNELVQESYESMVEMAERMPDQFSDRTYLKQMDQKLDSIDSWLLVKLGDQVIYWEGNKEYSEIEEFLPSYHENNRNIHTGIYVS